MHTRKQTMARLSDGVIALPGGCGTLEELLEIITWKQLGLYLNPIVVLNTEGFYNPLLKMLEHAAEEHFGTEFLDYKLAVRTVASLDGALAHIARYSSRHSEAIVTENKQAATQFTRSVDAACVYVNVSTAFTDGAQFGFGAEIGISTQKLHARGPMALPELTTYKYIIEGEGQIRQ